MRESLVAADPLNTDLRLMLVESYRYVGDMYFKLGDVKLAQDHYSKQFSLVKEMRAADPSDAQVLTNQAVALIKVGDVEAALGQTASAMSKYREAVKIREQLSAAAPADVYLRREVEEVRNKVQPAH